MILGLQTYVGIRTIVGLLSQAVHVRANTQPSSGAHAQPVKLAKWDQTLTNRWRVIQNINALPDKKSSHVPGSGVATTPVFPHGSTFFLFLSFAVSIAPLAAPRGVGFLTGGGQTPGNGGIAIGTNGPCPAIG